MDKKTKLSFEEFEAFRTKQEKSLLKWILIGDLLFLFLSLVGQFVDQEILKLGAVSWSNFWLLFFGNIVMFIVMLLAWATNFKIWLLKYLFAIYSPLLITSWIYFTNPQYIKLLFSGFLLGPILLAMLFYDIRGFFLSFFSGLVLSGLLLLYYSRIDSLFTSYEIFLGGLVFCLFSFIIPVGIFRIRIFLTELLQTRVNLQEAKTTLEVKVKARTQELEELTKTLDQKVKERTGELQERINQLERFGKLTIGRELRMAELKKEIEELKEKLKKYEK